MKKKGSRTRGEKRWGGRGRRKRREWNGKERKKERPLFFFSFRFLFRFLFFPVSMPFLRFHSLSLFVRFILFGRLVSSSNTRFSYGRNSICLFPSPGNGEPRNTRNNAKTEKIPYSLSALFCTDPRSSKFSFFSYHLEFINLESIILEFKDLIRKFV